MRHLWKSVSTFIAEEHGNAVIDWVVLLAGSVLLALSIVATVTANLGDITTGTSDRMAAIEVGGS